MSETYKIEKDIPIPEKHTRNRYPFGEMEVKDSFLFIAKRPNQVAANASWYVKGHPGVKFTIRAVSLKDAEGNIRYRCWRTA